MGYQILLVAAGGALGALSRFGISAFSYHFLSTRTAWGTLKANLIGCLLIGMVFALIDQRQVFGPSERLFLMTGFLGAMTTFSTYALESVQFIRGGEVGLAVLNLAANNLAGVALVLVGIWLGHRV